MKIFVASSGQDTGGQGYRIKRAFERLTDWRVRAMHMTDTFIRYPHDLRWDAELAGRMYDEADVVHHKNGLGLYERFQGNSTKPAVMHHQGTRLRENPAQANDEARSVGAVQVVSTVDLLADVDNGVWLPSPYDLDAIREKYRNPQGGKIRIGHAPTARKAKGTDAILKTLDHLSRWYDFEVDLIEWVSWKVCLSRKGQCDIYIDQITHGYGNNSIECFAMGIPVVSGWSDPADRDRFVEQTGEEPPFVEVTPDTLQTQLVKLLSDPDLREEYGARGRAFAERWHSEEKCVEIMKPVYENAPPTTGVWSLRRFNQEMRDANDRRRYREQRREKVTV